MSDRFAPKGSNVRPALDSLRRTLSGIEQFLVDAFQSVADPDLNVKSPSDVKRNLLTIVEMGVGIPWVLYDTISELLKISGLPQSTKEAIAQTVRIRTGRRCEHLRPTVDGSWQVAWEVDPNEDIEYREVALDWYVPPDLDKAPIVPEPIIDYIASGVSLLQENLVLPAAAVLLVALESVLWEALASIGIHRYVERIDYVAVKWKLLKRLTDKKKNTSMIVMTIEGADRGLDELKIGPNGPIIFEVRRKHAGDAKMKVELKLGVDAPLVEFFATSQVDGEPKKLPSGGLNTALERVRSREDELEYLAFFPSLVDETIVSLRNNLVHLPTRGDLDKPITIPGGGELKTVDELRSNPRVVRHLLNLIVRLTNAVYTSELNQEGTSTIE